METYETPLDPPLDSCQLYHALNCGSITHGYFMFEMHSVHKRKYTTQVHHNTVDLANDTFCFP